MRKARKRVPRQTVGCAGCMKVCKTSGCDHLVNALSKGDKCRKCEPTRWCLVCSGEYPAKECVTVGKTAEGKDNAWACKTCHKNYSCPKCKRFDTQQRLVSRGLAKMCEVCADAEDDKSRNKFKTFDKDELPKSGDLRIPSLPERPFRTVSIETELNGDGAYLARALYRCGLVERPIVEGYHQHAQAESKYPAFLKHDGSVSAGELITFLLNLDEKDHADVLLEIMAQVRSLEKTDKIQFTANCGGHIHIDAHNYTYSDVWRLASIFGYLEDPIFRMAGAGSKFGHRSLDPGHQRLADHHPEGGYTRPVIKGPWGVQSTFGLRAEQQGRGHALNFKPFFQARNNCTCGDTKYQTGAKCRCNLGKATIEWRVWNSTGNPRILHGWISFMQALHSYAQQSTSMSDKEEELYPELEWAKKPWASLTEPFHIKQKERLEWIFANLPLTPDERDSLVYVLKQSDFKAFGDEYLDGLLKVEGVGALAAKKPARNPNRRQRKLTITPPEPGSIPLDNPLGRRRREIRWQDAVPQAAPEW